MKIINKLVLAFFLLLNFKAFCQPTSFESRGIGGGGALFSPAINPADNNELFMACDMSEIYHSKNKGASWSMLHFKTIQKAGMTAKCNSPKMLLFGIVLIILPKTEPIIHAR